MHFVRCIILLAALSSKATHAQNLLRNGSFERGAAGWVHTPTRGAARAAIVAGVARTGRRAAEIRCPAPGRYVEWRPQPQPALAPGKRYLVSAWVKQRGVEGAPPYVEAYAFDAAGKPKRLHHQAGRGGTQDWYRLQAVVVPPAGSVRCRLAFGLAGAKGSVWFDDVQLVELPWPTRSNLAPNPSFEIPGAEWRPVETAERGQRPVWSDRVARTGKRSVCIEGLWPTGYGEWRIRENPRLAPGRDYVVWVWVRQELVRPEPPYIEIYSFDRRGKPTKVLHRPGRAGTRDWHPLAARFRVPGDSAYCRVALGLRESTGKAWFDDVCLAPAGAAEPPKPAARGEAEVLRVTRVDLPRVAQPGRAFDLVVWLQPTPPLKRKRLRFVLQMRNRDAVLLKTEAVVSAAALDPRAPRPAIRLRVQVSRYCPAGEIPLEIASPDARLAFAPAAARPRVTVGPAPREKETTARMRRMRGKPVLVLNGRAEPFLVYNKCFGFRRGHARRLGAAGVHLYELDIRWAQCELRPGVIDLSEVTRRALDALEGDPAAHLILKFRLDAPMWWSRRFPKECLASAAGHVSYSQSMASETWRRDAVRFMQRVVGRVRRFPWGARVMGGHIGAGKGGEFQMWGSALDYGPAMQAAWRAWAKRRPAAGGPGLPAPDELAHASPALIETNPRLREFALFLSDVNARAIAALAKGLRSLLGPDKTIGMYYGYLFEHAQRVLREGTLGIQQVVNLPEIQYQSAPETYYTRRLGETGGFMSPVDSLILRGKSFLLEADIRTHGWRPGAGYGQTWNAYQTKQVLRRELLLALTKGVGVRWLDLADYDRDAFGDPDVLRDMKRMSDAARAVLLETSMPAETAVFVDAPGLAWFSRRACGPFLKQLLALQRSELQRMGAPYDQYLLEDIHRADLPRYKVYVFLSPLRLTEKDRSRIREVACRGEQTVVWFYAPGLFDERGRSVRNIERLTGFRLAERGAGELAGELIPSNGPLARTAALRGKRFGEPMRAAPRFLPDDPDAAVLGRSAAGEPLLALKRMDGWTSIYAATNILPAALWREILRAAGAHIYTENDVPTYAGCGVVGVHAPRAGEQTITLPPALAGARVEAPFGQRFTFDGRRLRFRTRAGETVMFVVRRPKGVR